MNSTPLVSVLIPVHNGVFYAAEAIRSVQIQTFQSLEIIAVDDGSTDGSCELLQTLATMDPRIKVFRQNKEGTQSARNTALRHAKGEWIALLDQDDVWLPLKLESQLALLGTAPRPNLLFTNYFLWDGTHDLGRRYEKIHRFPEGDMSLRLIGDCLFGASSIMMPRLLADQVGGFDPIFHFSGDWDMWLKVAEKGIWSRGVWEPQMRYRLWSGNESKKSIPIRSEIIEMLQINLSRSQTRKRSYFYRRSLQVARCNLELAKARQFMVTNPAEITPALYRAWSMNRREMKWLIRWFLSVFSHVLGKKLSTILIHNKLRAKF